MYIEPLHPHPYITISSDLGIYKGDTVQLVYTPFTLTVLKPGDRGVVNTLGYDALYVDWERPYASLILFRGRDRFIKINDGSWVQKINTLLS